MGFVLRLWQQRFNHLPHLRKQTVNLHWGLWGCRATWHFHLISGLLLSSIPASSSDRSAHIRWYCLKRWPVSTMIMFNKIKVCLEQNLRARLDICVSGIDWNISYCCVTVQLAKSSKCTKGSGTRTPNKLIICIEECVVKQYVKLRICSAPD